MDWDDEKLVLTVTVEMGVGGARLYRRRQG